MHSERSVNVRINTVISHLQNLFRQHNIKDYFSGWIKFEQWNRAVDQTKIYEQGKVTAGDWLGATSHNGEHLTNLENNDYFKPNFNHPNELGHKVIAQHLYNWIFT